MCAAILMTALCLAADDVTTQVQLTVRETAGLRRFSYPVEVVLPLGVDRADHCQLLADGKPVSAQFRPGPDDKWVVLDFTLSLGPCEQRSFVVLSGRSVPPGPEPASRWRVEQTKSMVRIQRSAEQFFELPADLLGLLRRVHTKDGDYLREGSVGLVVRSKAGKTVRLGGPGTTVKVARRGAFAVAVRYSGLVAFGDKQGQFTADLTFPASKSWARIDLKVEDPHGVSGMMDVIEGLGVDLNLKVEGSPTLVDFGAPSTVYTTLKHGEQGRLSIDEQGNWGIETGAEGHLSVLARGAGWLPPGKPRPRSFNNVGSSLFSAPKPEGWAHIMDRQRCTAFAVAGFAGSWLSEIGVEADGRTHAWLTGRRSFTCWLHFVPMPVQVGAVTSPQSMLAPLMVEVKRR